MNSIKSVEQKSLAIELSLSKNSHIAKLLAAQIEANYDLQNALLPINHNLNEIDSEYIASCFDICRAATIAYYEAIAKC